MARRRSNPLALAVLECLSEKPMHPYEISSTLRTRGKEQSIKLNYGSLYSVVESLAKHGLISAQQTTREGRRPERTVYAITEAGQAELEDWLAELLATSTREYTSLEAGLSLAGALPPDEVARLLDKRCFALEMQLSALEKAGELGDQLQLPEIFAIESHYRHALLTAELAFVRRLVGRIRDGSLGGTTLWRRMHELRAAGMSYEQIMADPVGNLGEEARVLQAPESQN
ncbi:PadR family transcriptional regulator [Jatrophihabitans cynanchi]|uniref:PadR family transcriptional regulator n=1 Tax=Jatrophihabitans cynanchi TaxID=2944128 RepID=A0ABY7JWP5_9ACTN|nr:PadR family transcriptional regulator [Jatrophihabitans sp. SB3-54]WAX56824.1 PadR family transcriptional regulator [Jatrophihabitans sp. SB3-54]